MTARTWFRLFPLGVALALAGCTAAEPPARLADARAASAAAAPAWPHQASDLTPDEAARFGTLPNGMRYVLKRNATPAGAASIRLRFDAGSLHEAEDQRGLAHYIEHLTLNETRNVPEGELVRILERAGLRFGPDTNASTGFEQTLYMLDLPRADAETVDTALFLMREVAGEATLSQRAIDNERGIILSEERTRATPTFRLAEDELGFLYRDDILARRMPIGTTEVIQTAPRERFVAFYDNFYRPERATLVAVGDFDLDEMEAKIRARFSDWRARGADGGDRPPVNLPERGVETRVFVEPGVPTRVTMSWVAPLDESPDTAARRVARAEEALAIQILNRRFERIATSENAPLIAGLALRHRVGLRGEVVQVIGVSQAGAWTPALATIEQEQRRLVQHGVTDAEIAREVSEMRARLTAAAAGAATRNSADIAMAVVNSVNEGRVFLSPAAELALFDRAAEGLTAARVNAAAARVFAGGSGPLVHLASPQPVEGSETALAAAFAEARRTPVAAPQVQQAAAWPYTSFGTPGRVVERREIAGTGATAVRFANGVRLTVRPTQFRDDEVIASVRFGRGQLGLPTDRPSPIWGYAAGGFAAAGLGQLSFEDLQQVLAGRVYGLDAGVAEDAFTLSGRTRPEDLTVQLQLLAAYLTDPGWRAAGWDRLRSFSGTIHDQFETTPGGVFGRDSGALLRGGDARWETPSREQMAAGAIGELRALLEADMRSGPIEVVIVGDVEVDRAVAEVANTFGALPPRTEAAASGRPGVRFPAAGAVTRTHGGRADQALGFIAWPTTDFYSDVRRAQGLGLLARILQLRVTDEVRERQGAAYSPVAMHQAADHAGGFGYMGAMIEAPPAAVDAFFTDVLAMARDLRERPIEADELERARRPLVETMQRNRTSNNQWWVGALGGIHGQPARADSISRGVDMVNSFTPAELQALARQYLVEERAWRFSALPRAN
jgi:zinc protease